MNITQARLANLATRLEEATQEIISEAHGGMEAWMLLQEHSAWCEKQAWRFKRNEECQK